MTVVTTEVITKIVLKAEGVSEAVAVLKEETGVEIDPKWLITAYFMCIAPCTIKEKEAEVHIDTMTNDFYDFLDEYLTGNELMDKKNSMALQECGDKVVNAVLKALRNFGLFLDREDHEHLRFGCIKVMSDDTFIIAIAKATNDEEESVLYDYLVNSLAY